MGLPSVVNGALEMITIDPYGEDAVEEEAAHPATGEIPSLGERGGSSVAPYVTPTGSLTNEDPSESSLSPTPRSFKQRRTSSTSSQQKSLAYIEVELNPVTEENKSVIILTEKPTEYVKIAGVYKPFNPK